jgi:hypothetical protein
MRKRGPIQRGDGGCEGVHTNGVSVPCIAATP